MNNFDAPITESDFTGRYLVLLDENRQGDGIAQLQSLTDSSSIATAMQEPDLANEADIVMLDTLGVAILNHPVNVQQLSDMMAIVTGRVIRFKHCKREPDETILECLNLNYTMRKVNGRWKIIVGVPTEAACSPASAAQALDPQPLPNRA